MLQFKKKKKVYGKGKKNENQKRTGRPIETDSCIDLFGLFSPPEFSFL